MNVDPEAPIGRRQQRKEETRRALTDAALSLFEERGYAATTVADISERAQVAERTFFRYFPTKEAVLFPDFEDGKEPFLSALASCPPESSLMDDILAALLGGVSLAHENRELTIRRGAILSREERLQGEMAWSNLANSRQFLRGALAAHTGLPVTDERVRLGAGAALLLMSQSYDDWISGGADGDLAGIMRSKHAALCDLLTSS